MPLITAWSGVQSLAVAVRAVVVVVVVVAGAIRLAKQLGPGKTIVTILADSGNRYQSKLFNPEFMRSKNLPVPEWLEKRTKIDVPFEKV